MISDLVGCLKVIKGMVAWSDGPLIRAMREGKILIADEFNLVDSQLVMALMPMFEHLQSHTQSEHPIWIAEFPHPIVVHRDFRFIATQNSATELGRQELPIMVRDRVHTIRFREMNSNQLVSIAQSHLGSAHSSLCTMMAQTLIDINQHHRCNTSFTCRSLIRWCNRSREHLSDCNSDLELQQQQQRINVAMIGQDLLCQFCDDPTTAESIRDMIWTKIAGASPRQARTNRSIRDLIQASITHNEHVLLIGPTSRKSFEAHNAVKQGTQIWTMVCTPEMQIEDVIGGMMLERDHSSSQVVHTRWNDGIITKALRELSCLPVNETTTITSNKHILVIENIDLADAAVIERINGLLELKGNRWFSLAEDVAGDRQLSLSSEQLDNLTIIATVHVKHQSDLRSVMSAPLRSRFVEMWVEPFSIEQGLPDTDFSLIATSEILLHESGFDDADIRAWTEAMCKRWLHEQPRSGKQVVRWFDSCKLIKELSSRYSLGIEANIKLAIDLIDPSHHRSMSWSFDRGDTLEASEINLRMDDHDDQIIHCTASSHVIDRLTMHQAEAVARSLLWRSIRSAILISGPPGSGKSWLAGEITSLLSIEAVRCVCNAEMEISDMEHVCRKARSKALILDEINLAPISVMASLEQFSRQYNILCMIATCNPEHIAGRNKCPRFIDHHFAKVWNVSIQSINQPINHVYGSLMWQTNE